MPRRFPCILGACALALLTGLDALAQSARTMRVSLATGGAQASGTGVFGSSDPAISADGRFVTFTSSATNLVPNDTNGVADVFVHDRQTGTTTRVSVVTGGAEANGESGDSVISADGRHVAFTSDATNLVPGDTNGTQDVFIHDRATMTTTLVSEAFGGGVGGGCEIVLPGCPSSSFWVAMNDSGRFVSFESYATNLVPGGTSWADTFVRDVQAGVTRLVSVAVDGRDGDAASYDSALSTDGRYIAFTSGATNLVLGDTNDWGDVFVRDMLSGTTTRVSVPTGANQANGYSHDPAISADGRFIAFGSPAANMVKGDTNGVEDVFVHDRVTQTTTRVSVATGGGEADDASKRPEMSADGRYVLFRSVATNLVAGDTNLVSDVFVHDRQTGTTTRVSVGHAGNQANWESNEQAISASGRFVAFSSAATNLVAGDTNNTWDVFVRDRGSWPRDFEGDRVSDATVFRPSGGVWYQFRSSTGSGYGVAWGINGDVPAPGDYDGDGIADPAVFRPSAGAWFVLLSTTGTGMGVTWGLADDVPVPADYDGDGKTDVAVWRPSTGTWFIIRSSTGSAYAVSWGMNGDTPVPADFDGDGNADPTVFRASSGTWFELRSTTGSGFGVVWGQADDVPLVGDYDGDGKADPTVFRASSGTWYELRSSTGAGFGVTWGTLNDQPVVGDYDGDGKMDPTVFRPSSGMWYQLRSGTSVGWGIVWGLAGDVPQ